MSERRRGDDDLAGNDPGTGFTDRVARWYGSDGWQRVAGSFVSRWLVGPLVLLVASGWFMATVMRRSFGSGVAVGASTLIYLAISGHLRSDSSSDDPASAQPH